MSDMLTKLGIDGRLFIAQLVNFLILFAVLRAFAWKPILMALEERRAKIKKGIENAQLADRKIQDLEKEREEVLAKARNQAMEVLEQAEQKAKALQAEKIQKTQADIESQLNEAKEQIKGERTASYGALKQDLAKLVAAATGKIVKEMDTAAHEKLIHAALKDLETS
jgi:F-type H+-transporting ATPase subunit b